MNKINFFKPIFIISIDLELAWGFILNETDVYSLEILRILEDNKNKIRKLMNDILDLFDRYNIQTTWGVVGHLFLDQDEKNCIVDEGLPQFTENFINWDEYNELTDKSIYFGDDIVKNILSRQIVHEIGLHSFFHIPFSNCSSEIAEAELSLGKKVANKYGIKPVSFIFPQNKIGHLEVLKMNGIKIYRSENEKNLFHKICSNIIAPPVLPRYNDGLWEIPDSCEFYDPISPLRLKIRTKLGLREAIRRKRIFHIRFHPWNFLLDNDLSLYLDQFLKLVAGKRDEGKLEVMTMEQLVHFLESHFQRASPP